MRVCKKLTDGKKDLVFGFTSILDTEKVVRYDLYILSNSKPYFFDFIINFVTLVCKPRKNTEVI